MTWFADPLPPLEMQREHARYHVYAAVLVLLPAYDVNATDDIIDQEALWDLIDTGIDLGVGFGDLTVWIADHATDFEIRPKDLRAWAKSGVGITEALRPLWMLAPGSPLGEFGCLWSVRPTQTAASDPPIDDPAGLQHWLDA